MNVVGNAPSAYLAHVQSELLRKILSRLFLYMGHGVRMAAAQGAKARAIIVGQGRALKAELKSMWIRVQHLHRFCSEPTRSMLLPILNFDHPAVDTVQRLCAGFAGSSSHAEVMATGYNDLLALQGARLLRAMEQRSRCSYDLLCARTYWRAEVSKLRVRIDALLAPAAPPPVEPAPAASAPSRVADYAATPSMLVDVPCRRALAQRMMEGYARAVLLEEDASEAFEYVTSRTFSAEALAKRRGDQASLSSWSGKRGQYNGVRADAPQDTARPFGAAAPTWGGLARPL